MRFGELLQLLVAARYVEKDVTVSGQPIRGKKVSQRVRVVARLIPLGTEREHEIGLVGNVVGERRTCVR
jgi:hypothetical protein